MYTILVRSVAFLLLSLGMVQADTITLTAPQTLDPVQATKIKFIDFAVVNAEQTLIVHYQWMSANGTPIRDPDTFNATKTWVCRNIPAPSPDNLHCTGPGTPDACCTASGTGTCNVPIDTCFSDVFRFSVRAQDVGTPIGMGLRQLIWARMRQEIRAGGVDGSFD